MQPIEGVTAGGRSGVILGLHFAEERFVFDPERYVFILNRHDVVTGKLIIDRLRLVEGLVQNGQLEVLNAENGEVLGRTNPCIPVNIDGGRTIEAIERQIQHIEEKIAYYTYYSS